MVSIYEGDKYIFSHQPTETSTQTNTRTTAVYPDGKGAYTLNFRPNVQPLMLELTADDINNAELYGNKLTHAGVQAIQARRPRV